MKIAIKKKISSTGPQLTKPLYLRIVADSHFRPANYRKGLESIHFRRFLFHLPCALQYLP